MSQTHAHPERTKTIKKASHEADSVAATPQSGEGDHSRSHAAHLNAGPESHTRPAGNLRQGPTPGALRQPPQEVGRAGKQHRGE